MSPITNRTGDVWHAFLKGDFQDMLYGYRFDGKFSPQEGHYFDSSQILVDPYAKVSLRRMWIWLLHFAFMVHKIALSMIFSLSGIWC